MTAESILVWPDLRFDSWWFTVSVLGLLIIVGLLNALLGDSFIDASDAHDGSVDTILPPGDSLTDFVVGTIYVEMMEQQDR